MWLRILLLLWACAPGVAGAAAPEPITAAVAISLKDAMADIAAKYKEDGGGQVQFTFGSSGQLMAQIANGAPIDLFISAASKQVDDLNRQGLVDAASRRIVAGNALVLIAPAGAASPPKSFSDLADTRHQRIAIGDPGTVPAGDYAMQTLKALKLDATLKDRLVYGANVRQVLDYVERGEVAAGIVYRTDAMESGRKVTVVADAPAESHQPIEYPAVIVAASKRKAAAASFLEYLRGEQAQRILSARGFPTATPTTKPSTRGT